MNTMHMMKRSLVLALALFGANGAWADYHLNLKSSTVVSASGGLSSTLFGSGAYKLYTNNTCTTVAAKPVPAAGFYYLKMDTATWWFGTPLLRYSDGEFHGTTDPSADPLRTFPVEDFTIQAPACFRVVANPTNQNINLNGLVLRTALGAQLSFATAGSYSFNGGTKFSVHSGTYKSRFTTGAIPEPGTLALLLAGVGGLALALRRKPNRGEVA